MRPRLSRTREAANKVPAACCSCTAGRRRPGGTARTRRAVEEPLRGPAKELFTEAWAGRRDPRGSAGPRLPPQGARSSPEGQGEEVFSEGPRELGPGGLPATRPAHPPLLSFVSPCRWPKAAESDLLQGASFPGPRLGQKRVDTGLGGD